MRFFVVVFALMSCCFCHASKDEVEIGDDSVEVSLLTCAPGSEVYSLYGHTALRYHDLRTGADWTFNYGVFDFRKPFFSLRFMLGLTDYQLGVVPFMMFAREYYRSGRAVTEQVLELTSEEKKTLKLALDENYKDENREYRYNFFRDNCTTRARDMIERAIIGSKVQYPAERIGFVNDEGLNTLRDYIHWYTEGSPWARFGNDICLGFAADRNMTWRESQFLPEMLMDDFANTSIVGGKTGVRRMVKTTRIVVDPGVRFVKSGFPLSPWACFAILLIVTVLVSIKEYRRKKTFVAFDAILMSLTGLAGVFVTLFFCSQHPTTSTNLQILLLNPLPLFFLIKVIQRKAVVYWKISLVLIVLFFLGFFIQSYAEGMGFLALCLLIRAYMNLHFQYPNIRKQ